MITLDGKLKDFGHATFLLMMINSHKSEQDIDRNIDSKHVKDDFINYINNITIDLADRNRLFAKALYHFMNRVKSFTIKDLLTLLIYIKNHFIDDFKGSYKSLINEYKEIKKIKVTKLNKLEVTNRIENFNKKSQMVHYTYLEFKEGFLDYLIDYLELIGVEYSENISEIMPLQKNEIEFITNIREYIDNIFGHYHKLEISKSDFTE